MLGNYEESKEVVSDFFKINLKLTFQVIDRQVRGKYCLISGTGKMTPLPPETVSAAPH